VMISGRGEQKEKERPEFSKIENAVDVLDS
jgi:hypothetical protein